MPTVPVDTLKTDVASSCREKRTATHTNPARLQHFAMCKDLPMGTDAKHRHTRKLSISQCSVDLDWRADADAETELATR